eukprot:617946_1
MGSQFCSRNCRFSTEGTDDTDPSTSSSIMWAEIESPSSSPEPEQKSVICAAPECDTLTESTSSKFCSPDCRTEATASRKRARQAEVQRRAAETAEAEARKRAGEAVAKSRTMLAAVVGEKMAEGLLRAVHASVDDSRARVRRVRLLVAALRRNSALRGRVLSGALSVGALARMSEEEMADAQLTRRREHAQQESILSRVITTKRDHLSGGKHVLSDRNDIRNEDSVLIVDSAPSSSAADEIMVSSEAVPSDSIGMVQSSSGLGRHSLQEVSSSYSNQLGSMDETSLNRCLLQLEGQVWSVTASGCNGIKNPGSSSGIRNQGSGGSVSDPDSDSESDSSSDSDSGSESPLIGSDCSKPNEINEKSQSNSVVSEQPVPNILWEGKLLKCRALGSSLKVYLRLTAGPPVVLSAAKPLTTPLATSSATAKPLATASIQLRTKGKINAESLTELLQKSAWTSRRQLNIFSMETDPQDSARLSQLSNTTAKRSESLWLNCL